MEALGTGQGGLDGDEASRRLSEAGPNSIAIRKEISPIGIFIDQFKNLLVALLLLAATVNLALSFLAPHEAEALDALLIYLIVLANAFFGFIQEYKAERSIEALTRMSAPKATVMRDGRETDIPSEQVVPGDILVLREGDKVAADARIIESHSLYSDESSLTGESLPSEKDDGKVSARSPLADRRCMVFMNSVITRGRGTALVAQTGLSTEIGRIAKEISEAPKKVTRFHIEIEDLGRKISLMTLAALMLIVLFRLFLGGESLLSVFLTAVALGVAAIPEGLPAVVTLSLSMATGRMLERKALMRRLSTVQDLGAVDTICTDKTGTLTENAMTVVSIFAEGRMRSVSGTGRSLQGSISPPPSSKTFERLLMCAYLCNDSWVDPKDPEAGFRGDPTEIALLLPAYKAGVDVEVARKKHKRVGEVPFSSERKLMSTVNEVGKDLCAFVKGAPESLLPLCSMLETEGKLRPMSDDERNRLLAVNREMASGALRVLSLAYKRNPASDSQEDVERDLVFLGHMGMMDPAREGVRSAIDDCRKAGIRVVMITGDNKFTARAAGKGPGFEGDGNAGEEIERMDERSLSLAVERNDIFSRVSPAHKVRLLKALKAGGRIVCMTGDGVNDAAAMKNADVGIAMGIRGTEVTKQASDIIILDDNFISIRDAIEEGRGTFDNIRKFVVYLLGANIAEVLFVFAASVLGLALSPKLAIQLLWINLVTDGLPALALGVDPPARDVMGRPPRSKDERMVNADAIYFLGAIGLSATIALVFTLTYSIPLFGEQAAWSAVFTLFVLLEMLTVYIVRLRFKSDGLSNIYLHAAVALSVALQLLAVYGPLGFLFGTVPLGAGEWEAIGAALASFGVLVWLMMRIEGRVLALLRKA